MSVNLYTVSLASLVSEPNPYPTINVPITLYTNSNHTTPFLPYTDASATNVLTSNVITSDRLGQLNLFAQPGTYYGTNPDLGNITITVTNPGSGAFDTRYAAVNDSRITGAAQVAQNLADLASASAARTSLGLGTAATQASTVFAPAMVVGGIFFPEAYGAWTGVDDTAIITAARQAAQAAGGRLQFQPGKTYVSDNQTISAPCSVLIPATTTLQLKGGATESSGHLDAWTITSSSVQFICEGWIDANKSAYSQSAFNAAGGSTSKYYYGIRVQGTSGAHLTDVTVKARINNAVDQASFIAYLDHGSVDITADQCAGVLGLTDSTGVDVSVLGYTIDNAGWKVFPHVFDVFRCADITVGRAVCLDHHGSGTVAAGTSRSNYVSGMTVMGSSRIRCGTLAMRLRDDDTSVQAVGYSIVGADELTVQSMMSTGYQEIHLELGGVTNSSFGHIVADGHYRVDANNLGTGRGIAEYNNSFYPDFVGRSQHYTENVHFGEVTIFRNRGHAIDLWAARNTTWDNVRCYANQMALRSKWQPVDASYPQPAVKDLTGHRFNNYDFSYNEHHGAQIYDLKSSAFVNGKANNNGQATAYPTGDRYSGGRPTNASGFALETSVQGSPLTKSGLQWGFIEGNDDQTWTDTVSQNPASPTVLSTTDDSRYKIGQTFKLVGAGAGGADLITRINDVTRDEITVADAPSTFPTVVGTGTVSSSGTTLTGSGTVFNTELTGRYWIVAVGQTMQVETVTSDTAATTVAAFSPALAAGTTFTIYKTGSAGIPSQVYGMRFGADTISPRVGFGSFAGNTSGFGISNGTVSGSLLTKVAILSDTTYVPNSIETGGNLTAVMGTGAQVKLGALGPSGQGAIQINTEPESTLYRKSGKGLQTDATFTANGGLQVAAVSKAGNYTLTATDSTVFCTGTNTQTLASAVTAGAGRRYEIKNVGTGTITVAATAGTVDITSLAAGNSAIYESDGTNWYAIAYTTPSTNTQVFTSSGTWTKPYGAVDVDCIVLSGGSGGGSGRRGAAGTVRCGGGGGAGGGFTRRRVAASVLGSTEPVTVGAGGTGGAAVTTDSTDGNAGSAGGTSFLGTAASSYGICAAGPNGGAAGTATAGAGASGSTAQMIGSAGGSANTSGGTGGAAVASPVGQLAAGGGGGAGGGISSGDVVASGGTGIGSSLWQSGGAGGTSGGSGGNGGPVTGSGSNPMPGSGGGGGASSVTAAGGTGGNGGQYGGGGGGGAAGLNGNNSGAGGNGGNGLVVVTSYF